MKRMIVALFSSMVLFVSSAMANPNLYWRFANPVVYNNGTNCVLNFDVQVSCTQAGTYISSTQVYFDYNTLAFGSYIFANNKITYELCFNPPWPPPYPPGINAADNSPHTFAILLEASFIIPNPSFMPVTPQYPEFLCLFSFTIIISDPSQAAGIVFRPDMMNGGTYYVDATHPTETKYGDPPGYAYIYENDLLNQPLTCNNVQLELWTLLEGPYEGIMMNNDLFSLLPLSQPFNPTLPYFGNPAPDWYYTGTEAVASIPNPATVDWVLVELRDAPDAASATSSTMVARKACFLLSDGSIADLDGYSIPSFNLTINQGLFVVIWHRNHLGIMSATPLVPNGTIYSHFFTTGPGQAFGGANAQKEIGAGVWGMIAGDGNADGQVSNADKLEVWKVQSGNSGYLAGDFNMDAQVNNADKIDFWTPNSGRSCQVP
jgi:hypothetical protein